ncbi:hypothetical protein acdb102_27730 [Acidothermaceae bacterium B102]|nr:hypothetical protein acdb102_27730 [Acidothermaceae bacterium B102]
MTDEANEQQPDLSETLEEIAQQAQTVDLSAAVTRKARSLRRRRNAAGGAAAILVLGVVGGGGWALTRTTGSSSVNGMAGAGPTSSSFGWYAYTPLPDATPIVRTYPSSDGYVTPAAPSAGVTEAAAATGYTTDSPSPGTLTTTTAPATLPAPNPHPLPCAVADNFADPTVTAAEKQHAQAMGTALCRLVGGGAHYTIEEWISNGGLSGMFHGLTYDIEAHLIGAHAGPVNNEAWLAIHLAPAGTTPTFPDGTMVTLQTDLATLLKDKIEVQGGPFDAFAGG